jgi:tetratricopeptide (TPR) repeat protein
MIEDLEHSLRLVPDEAERYYAMALTELMLGEFLRAVNSLNLAIRANTKHMPALNLLGDLYFKLGHYEQAAVALEQVLAQEPDNIAAITWLCMAYQCLGNKGKALAKHSLLQNIAPDLVVSIIKE